MTKTKSHLMKKGIVFIVFSVAILLIYSCKNQTITKDAERFCQCRQDNFIHPENCNDLLQELSDKYQFDEQGAAELKEKIDECLNH